MLQAATHRHEVELEDQEGPHAVECAVHGQQRAPLHKRLAKHELAPPAAPTGQAPCACRYACRGSCSRGTEKTAAHHPRRRCCPELGRQAGPASRADSNCSRLKCAASGGPLQQPCLTSLLPIASRSRRVRGPAPNPLSHWSRRWKCCQRPQGWKRGREARASRVCACPTAHPTGPASAPGGRRMRRMQHVCGSVADRLTFGRKADCLLCSQAANQVAHPARSKAPLLPTKCPPGRCHPQPGLPCAQHPARTATR